MIKTPTLAWMKNYREAVNTDPEMEVIGEWFSNDFKISFEGSDFLISVRRGKIIEIAENPRFDRPVAFTLRAPMSVWNKFINPTPPPLYHDFFAMLMRIDDFQLDGDSLATMQNARALHRMMNILKKMEPINAPV
ncbi:MAG: hypothetical protein VX007_11120 [Pseudomonadota bacterium]|nr:hypothetical protein [Pseudomonadota bacterium]MEC8290162.1 hypothetical protein [Pseudomonadota bacterium]